MSVRISASALDQAMAHARATPNVEVCGLLWGSRNRILRVEPTANVARDPSNWFEIDPQQLIDALRASRTGDEKVIGHYHSHPHGSPEPSPRDLAAAEAGKLWLIIGANSARLWLAEPAAFRETQLIIT